MIFFAYGTLRPGGSRHDLIAADVMGSMEGSFEGRLFAMPGGSPILVEGEALYPVQGTLLMLPDSPAILDRLDRLVGSTDPRSPYRRVQRRVISDRGDNLAWVYVCKQTEVYRVLSEGREIPEGDWLLE